MTAYNVVRMRVKPGREQEFLERQKKGLTDARERMRKNGLRHGHVVKTGDRSYCFLAEWDSMDALAKSRPEMIQELDRIRDVLEDLGHGLGVTDPVSGEVVFDIA